MQFNKVLKGLLLALPVLAVAACSSHKNNNDQSGSTTGADSAYGNGMSGNGSNGNMSSDEQARLQMQQLQQNNIVYFGLDKYDILPEFAQMLINTLTSYVATHLIK